METRPLISVILPFFNAGPAFAPALRSILRQDYDNWELLLCDDGSTDGSLELARSIQDSRVAVWSDGRNAGLAARLNECLDRTRGALVARMDADDISYPQRFRRQVEFLHKHQEIDLVGCPMLVCDEDGRAIGRRSAPLYHAGIVATPALGFGVAHPTWMVRADWYRHYRYDPEALRFEDADLLYRGYRHSRFANLATVLYGYREMSGGFGKRWKTRLGRVRYLGARRRELGNGLLLRAAAAEGIKAAMDAGLTAAGARYGMLRLREDPLTAAEHAEWNALRASLDQGKDFVASGAAARSVYA